MSIQAKLRAVEGRRHAVALMTASTALALVPGVAHADTAVQGETLTLSPSNAGQVMTDTAASGGKALKIWSNGAGSRSISPSADSAKLVVRARGQQCSGAPTMVVSVDGVSRLSTSVASTGYADYSAALTLPQGAHTLKVAFTNDYRSASCDRNLIVDAVTLQAATPAPAPTAPVSLKTGFEKRAGSGWTTLSEEQSYLRDLDAASARVSVAEIGRSVQGRPIQLVTVGAPRTKAEIAAGSSVLFVCTQHGNEPAGREACLQGARDHASATDASTLLIVPTANPDGFAHTSRHNASGVDVNRDHLKLASAEARALAAVVRDYKPDLLGDMHEYSASGASGVLFGDPSKNHLNADPEITQLAGTLHRSYVVPALTGAGFTTGFYSTGSHAADETVMRQQAALRHTPALLVETPRLGTLSAYRRVKAQHTALGAIVRMARERTTELASATTGARRRAVAEGAAGDQRYYYVSPSLYSDAPPCGYRLTDSQYRAAQRTLGLHGIMARSANGSWTISAGQAAQPSIGLLLDSRAPRELTAGARLPC
jgi:predicted deacylase